MQPLQMPVWVKDRSHTPLSSKTTTSLLLTLTDQPQQEDSHLDTNPEKAQSELITNLATKLTDQRNTWLSVLSPIVPEQN